MLTNPIILCPFLGGALCLAVALFLIVDLSWRNRGTASMIELSRAIRTGAREFMMRESFLTAVIVLLIFILLAAMQAWLPKARLDWTVGVALLLGALFTALAGIIGLSVAVRANSRTAEAARLGGMSSALRVALDGGAVMGLCVAGFSLIGLGTVLVLFAHSAVHFYAYGLGTSLVAMVGHISGGIYTKGADIGADTVTRSEPGFSENDARNAAVIADSVGDNLSSVAGFGTNLMESYQEAIIAAIAIALTLQSNTGTGWWGLAALPLMVGVAGAAASAIGIFATRIFVRDHPQNGLMLTTMLAAALALATAWGLVNITGEDFALELTRAGCTRAGIFLALTLGFAAGALIGFFSEFYTSYNYRPTRRIAERGQYGTALAVIEGLSTGFKSSAIPALILAATVYFAHRQAGYYGIAMAAAGMLILVALSVTLNAFGPIVDNAGGIAEIVHLDRTVRDTMESLHAVSNVTAAMGKGFANGSSALVALALLLAFIRQGGLGPGDVSLDRPTVLAGLLVGAMAPFYLSSLMLHAVGSTASAMVDEVRRQLREVPGLREGKTRPAYTRCNELATRRAVRGVLAPIVLILAGPVGVGLLLGKGGLAGFLAGALAGSLALGFQMVNSGGAMDNAKKYIEEGYFGGKGSEAHKAAVVGDMVGDSLKDTVGPSLAVMVKLMCVIALLISPLLK